MGELVVREWRGAVYGCVIPASEELLYSRRMHWLASLLRVVLSAGLVLSFAGRSCEQQSSESASHLGFDRNEYPGDEAMATLRKQFVFVGYWLSPPPGGQTNNWSGTWCLKRPRPAQFVGKISRERTFLDLFWTLVLVLTLSSRMLSPLISNMGTQTRLPKFGLHNPLTAYIARTV